ncbi:hypothetical protein, partial [Bacteroides uniformis]|uniref:hypothetical protein n=1 Tax=Bacteroides uniformis TaxID=820 RepID=UPI001AA108A9
VQENIVAIDSKDELACSNSQEKIEEKNVWKTVGVSTARENQSFTLTKDEGTVTRKLGFTAGINQEEGRP